MGKSFGPTGLHTSNIRSYNNAMSFISLGAKLDRAITNTMNSAGVYTFRIQGALHHFMGSLLPPPGERLRFVQVYMFDSAQEQLQFRHESQPNLQLDILQLLSTVLREVNPYVQFWRDTAERIAENAQLTIRLTMPNPTIRNPHRYNRYWNVARTFDSARTFDGRSHKTDDLELFEFVMICKFALIF